MNKVITTGASRQYLRPSNQTDMTTQRKWRFNEKKPQQFRDRKSEILDKLNGQVKRREALAALALQIKGIIQANDGKCYDVRLDRQIKQAADQANAQGLNGGGHITAWIKSKRGYGDACCLEIELRNSEGRYSYTEYESYWLSVQLTSHARGRIRAATTYDPDANTGATNEIKDAISRFDEVAAVYARFCQAADDMNEVSYFLRAFMEKVYVSGMV